MRTIIAGSRDIEDYELVCKVIQESGFEITEVVTGMARGVDLLAERWGYENDVNIQRFYAKWNEYGKMAGKIRNMAMAAEADACICVWDGMSPGTRHMIETAKAKGLKLYVYRTTADQ